MTVGLNGHCLYVEKLLQHSQVVGKEERLEGYTGTEEFAPKEAER